MKKLLFLLFLPVLLQAQTTAEWLTPIANIEFEGDKIVYGFCNACDPNYQLQIKVTFPDIFSSIPVPVNFHHCRDIPKYRKMVWNYLNTFPASLHSQNEKIKYIKTFALQTLWAINGEPLPTERAMEIMQQLASSPGKETSHTASVALKLYDKIKTDHSATNISTRDYANPDNTKIKTAPLFSNQFIPGNPAIKSVNSDSVCWPKYYGEPNSYELSFEVEETYDGGYYVLGNITSNLVYEKSWLIKTDVNGEILWEKIFSDSGHNLCLAMEPTMEGGVLLCGWIRYEGEENSNPSVIKLDACGEKIWCRIFSENIGDAVSKWANDVKETPSGDIIVLVNEYGHHPINTMHLFKLDADGEVLWRNPYASANNHPGSINPMGQKILISNEGNYLIAGNIYWKDPWNPGGSFVLRPLFALVDSLGNEKWVLPFGLYDTIIGQAMSIAEIQSDRFIGVGFAYSSNGYDNGLIMSVSLDGEELDYNAIDAKSIDSSMNRVLFYEAYKIDSAYVFGGVMGVESSGNPTMETISDTNIFSPLTSFEHLIRYENLITPYSMGTTILNKVLSTSTLKLSNNWDISLSKLNQNLEYDTLDPGNYTYDSLCTTPGLPQSGFISLDDCDLFTDIGEIPTAKQYREKIRWIPISAYPNPVTEGKLTLEFENTEHHKNMELRCYDDFGRQVHSRKIYKGQQDTDVDVSGWPSGIYIAVVYSDGSARGKAKFVVR